MAGGRASFLQIGQAKLDQYGEDVLTFAQPWHFALAPRCCRRAPPGRVCRGADCVVAYDISENGRLRRVYRL